MRRFPLSTLVLTVSNMLLADCVMGIPDADGWKAPPPKKPCVPIYVDGVFKGCLDSEFARRNMPQR